MHLLREIFLGDRGIDRIEEEEISSNFIPIRRETNQNRTLKIQAGNEGENRPRNRRLVNFLISFPIMQIRLRTRQALIPSSLVELRFGQWSSKDNFHN